MADTTASETSALTPLPATSGEIQSTDWSLVAVTAVAAGAVVALFLLSLRHAERAAR